MAVKGIHHVGLVVDDLDAAITFYSALLDIREIERDHWRAPAPVEDQAVGLVASSADGVMLKGSDSYELGGSKMGDPVDLDDASAAVVYCRDPIGTILELMATGDSLAGLDDL